MDERDEVSRRLLLNHFMGWAGAMIDLDRKRLREHPIPYLDLQEDEERRVAEMERVYGKVQDGDWSWIHPLMKDTIPAPLVGLWRDWAVRFRVLEDGD